MNEVLFQSWTMWNGLPMWFEFTHTLASSKDLTDPDFPPRTVYASLIYCLF